METGSHHRPPSSHADSVAGSVADITYRTSSPMVLSLQSLQGQPRFDGPLWLPHEVKLDGTLVERAKDQTCFGPVYPRLSCLYPRQGLSFGGFHCHFL